MPQRTSPNKDTPWLENNVLHIGQGDTEQTIALGSPTWTTWLQNASQFYVKNTQHGNFSCRKDTRERGGVYWSAYRRVNGHSYRAYVGKDSDLTSYHLNDIAQRLKSKIYGKQGLEAPERTKHIDPPHIQAVHMDDKRLWFDLVDGRVLGVPLAWFPRLVSATPEQRQHWHISGTGISVHWPDIDEDISVRMLMNFSSS